MSKVSILIVEDDEIITKVIDWRLNNLGYSVCGKTSTGIEALNFLKEQTPDLILMDINIKGGMDGIETAKKIKEIYSIPFVYITSHSDGPTLERAKETKPDGFIIKPFDDNDLRVAIELALKK